MPTYTITFTVEDKHEEQRQREAMHAALGDLAELVRDTQPAEGPIIQILDPDRLDALLNAVPENKVKPRGRPRSYERISADMWERIRRLVMLVKPELLDEIENEEADADDEDDEL